MQNLDAIQSIPAEGCGRRKTSTKHLSDGHSYSVLKFVVHHDYNKSSVSSIAHVGEAYSGAEKEVAEPCFIRWMFGASSAYKPQCLGCLTARNIVG